jgi:hypothetical protein
MTMCRCQMRGCDHCDVRRVDGMIGIRLGSLAKCHKISSGPCPGLFSSLCCHRTPPRPSPQLPKRIKRVNRSGMYPEAAAFGD